MSDFPYKSPESTDKTTVPRKPKSPIAKLGYIVLSIVAIGILIGMLLPAMRRGVPEATRRMACLNNTRQLMLAMRIYETVNGEFPPAYTVDSNGNRLHSWRSLILPFMEHEELYEKIDFTKPWDDPANKEARETIVECYQCPNTNLKGGLTTYLGVVGDRSFFTGSDPQKFRDLTDGTTQTIAVCDVNSSDAVHWMSPQDASVELILSYGPDSKMNHPGSLNVACVDGSTYWIYLNQDNEEYQQLKDWLTTEKKNESNE